MFSGQLPFIQRLGFNLDMQNLPTFGQVSIGGPKFLLSGPGASGSRPLPDAVNKSPADGTAETTVMRADAPKVLECNWGGFDAVGTRSLRRHAPDAVDQHRSPLHLDRCCRVHICFDVLDHLLSGTPIGRIVGPEAMKFGGWQRLNAEYAQPFGVEAPNLPPNAPKR